MKNLRITLYVVALIVSLAFVWFTGPAHPSWAQEPGPGLGLEVSPEAVTPARLLYQGRITNPSTGDAISGTFTIYFRIYDDPAAGTKLWEEGKDIQVSAGLFSTPLGDITPLDPAMFNGQNLWLAVKVGADPEAVPRKQVLPVAYALGLLPGATVSTTAASPALTLRNAGSGDALRVEGRVYVTGDLAVGGNMVGGAHDHDDRYINSTIPDAMSGSSSGSMLAVTNSGAGPAGLYSSTGGNGLRADTGSTASESAGLMGVAGWTSTMLNGYAGVYGKSRYGYGVAGVSDNGPAVVGQSGVNNGVYATAGSGPAAIYGTNTGTGPAVYGYKSSGTSGPALQAYSYGTGNGIQAYSTGGWSAYVYGGGSGALYAGGNSTVAGTLTTQRVAYSTPRTHYWSVGGEAFVPANNSLTYYNQGGNGGAYICQATYAWLNAPVNLPQGATITRVTLYYYDNDPSYNMGVYLAGLYLASGGYTGDIAALYTTTADAVEGHSTYVNTNYTVDNTSFAYKLGAYAYWGSCAMKVRGVVIQYTLSEAE